MGQQYLVYSFVARGTVIVAEFTGFTGNFTSIASQYLQRLPATANTFIYNIDGHTFNYLVEDGFTYCVVALESAGRHIPMAFLERIKYDFTKRYGCGKPAIAAANSLNREFGPKLQEQMQWSGNHPEEINKLVKVKTQVSEVKGVMMENIEKVLQSGEKIELPDDKKENLRSQVLQCGEKIELLDDKKENLRSQVLRRVFFENHFQRLKYLYQQQKGGVKIWVSVRDYLSFFCVLTSFEKEIFDKFLVQEGIRVSLAVGIEDSLVHFNRYLWVRPPLGWWKANIDGGVLDSGEAGVGIAFRDDEGKLGPIYSIIIKNKHKPLEAELEALDIAAFLSIRHRFDNVIIQSDCKFLCRMVWGVDSIPCEHLVRFLQLGLNRLRAYEVSLTPRQSNRVADCLATAATKRFAPQNREMEFRGARLLSWQEQRGIPFYRVHRKFSTQGFCGQQHEKCKGVSHLSSALKQTASKVKVTHFERLVKWGIRIARLV